MIVIFVLIGVETGFKPVPTNEPSITWSFTPQKALLILSSPAVVNIDGLGLPEIIMPTENYLYCVNGDGTIKWSSRLPNESANAFSLGVSPYHVSDLNFDLSVPSSKPPDNWLTQPVEYLPSR